MKKLPTCAFPSFVAIAASPGLTAFGCDLPSAIYSVHALLLPFPPSQTCHLYLLLLYSAPPSSHTHSLVHITITPAWTSNLVLGLL